MFRVNFRPPYPPYNLNTLNDTVMTTVVCALLCALLSLLSLLHPSASAIGLLHWSSVDCYTSPPARAFTYVDLTACACVRVLVCSNKVTSVSRCC